MALTESARIRFTEGTKLARKIIASPAASRNSIVRTGVPVRA